MRLGAIDIGSNAARLLIMEVLPPKKGNPQFNKLNLLRVPLRLGFDVFEEQMISAPKKQMLVETMQSFRHLMNAYNVERWTACATSAMRDAGNSAEIIGEVREKAGIDIRIITGDEEANLIYENHVAENMDKENSYLYIDVGGGSTEISLFNDGILVFKKSFNIGTIRLLKSQVGEQDWDLMRNTIKAVTKGLRSVIAIGSGGNINKVFEISGLKAGKPLPIERLRQYYKEIGRLSLSERMAAFEMKPDRADVIVPALDIYVRAMRWANAKEIFVPKIGLADGLIHHLYDEAMAGKKPVPA